ncbi:MAG TPA: hypothetical protein VHC69_18870 [Polyangiaceae bacterium]|nr:hypothetical protein [Polyangiaceae bacterium]
MRQQQIKLRRRRYRRRYLDGRQLGYRRHYLYLYGRQLGYRRFHLDRRQLGYRRLCRYIRNEWGDERQQRRRAERRRVHVRLRAGKRRPDVDRLQRLLLLARRRSNVAGADTHLRRGPLLHRSRPNHRLHVTEPPRHDDESLRRHDERTSNA